MLSASAVMMVRAVDPSSLWVLVVIQWVETCDVMVLLIDFKQSGGRARRICRTADHFRTQFYHEMMDHCVKAV